MKRFLWNFFDLLGVITIFLLLVVFFAHADKVKSQEITDVDLNVPTVNLEDLPEMPPIHIQPGFDVGSEVAFVYDLTTNESVYAKNSAQQMSIASITKMMTAYVVLSQKLNLDEVITITKDDVALASHFERSRLVPGMRFTRERLLNLALMSSENRAAAALGRTTFPGGLPEFIDAMNQMANTLHMEHTHYVDPIGINAEDQSTAEDLVKLITVASQEDVIAEFSTTKWKQVDLPTKQYRGHPVVYRNTNALVGFHDWNILVQKTGFTNAAGHCVVMVVDIQDHQYAVIELNAPNNQQRAFDAIKLRHWVEDRTELSKSEVETFSPYQGIKIAHAKPIYGHHHKRNQA